MTSMTRSILSRTSIVLVLLISIVFLVGLTQVEAATRCTNKYTGTAKITDGSDTYKREIKSYTFYVRDGNTRKKYTLYRIQQRTCAYGHYEKYYNERIYCPNTKKCENSGKVIKIPYGRWSKCTGWVTVGYVIK